MVKIHPPLGLSQDGFTTLNERMNSLAHKKLWASIAQGIGDDRFEWSELDVLFCLVGTLSTITTKAKFMDPHISSESARLFFENMNADEFREWQEGFWMGIRDRNWAKLASHPKIKKSPPFNIMRNDVRISTSRKLKAAYGKPFIGGTDVDFIEYLNKTDKEIEKNKSVCAKAVAVVQSSGTGKSRMLTEVGKRVFTLPICLRGPLDPGYPFSDVDVVDYFDSLDIRNDLSITAHIAIVRFIAAAHTIMLNWLQEEQAKQGNSASQLLLYWHQLVESPEKRDRRKQFFEQVVQHANSLKSKIPGDISNPESLYSGKSPQRIPGTNLVPPEYDFTLISEKLYNSIAKEATENLMDFLSTLQPPQDLCVTYFDEAHELGLCFWILLRLLANQESSTKMWYVFMGTKSSLSYYAPRPANRLSLRLRVELSQLLPPYVALGFDQQMVAKNRAAVKSHMQDFQTLKHLSQFGRPLWSAQLSEEICSDKDIVTLATLKLTNGQEFKPTDKYHVFAVLSQRLCLDPVLVGSEALELADRSVAHHMRLLTGFSATGDAFYTHSPSEPILVLGSHHLLYKQPGGQLLAPVLDTLTTDLCSAGLVEKGLLGELGARTLLLIARDFATPDLLQPVGLLRFLGSLFGSKSWAGGDQPKFDEAFRDAHVNFTHWMVTRDPIPEESPNLLTNLWSRGAGLQCCFIQDSIDFVIPLYSGPLDGVFDPSYLSSLNCQIKFQIAAATKAESDAIRSAGVPRDRHEPLPYLALLMELGNEANYQETGSKMKSTAAGPVEDGQFAKLTDNWISALTSLQEFRKQTQNPTEAAIKAKKAAVRKSRLAKDHYNRYIVSARGASPGVYGILREARIEKEFARLLSVIMPAPSNQDRTIQHMRPLERLGVDSGHTAWMVKYVTDVDPTKADTVDNEDMDMESD